MTGEIIISDLIPGKCAIDAAPSSLTFCRSSPHAIPMLRLQRSAGQFSHLAVAVFDPSAAI
jgi:hypothetical protein